MLSLIWIRGLFRKRSGRLLAEAAGIGLTVLLLASLGAFFASSKARMTQQASAGVAVDWQVQLEAGTDAAHALQTVTSAPGVVAGLPVGYADAAGFRSRSGSSVQTTGSGKVLGIPSAYAATFPGEIRYLVGARTGVLLAQQTAANLRARVGTPVTVERPGQNPVTVTVDGIVDLPGADSLFQSIGSAPGSAPTAPPDNVMLLPAATWDRLFSNAAARGVSHQIHVNLSPDLPPDPGAAFSNVLGRAKNLEAALAGGGLVGNNLGAQLDAARADATYAELLFLFLGAPGVVLGAALTAAVAGSGRERRRKEQALLRTRGASASLIIRLTSLEATAVGAAGAVTGLSGAVIAGRVAFGSVRFGATTLETVAWAGVATLAAMALAFASIVLPARRDLRELTVRKSQLELTPPRQALWERLYFDVLCLGLGGLLYWEAVRSGYQVVFAPEGVPTISVNVSTLLAPLLMWVGAILLAWRLARLALAHGRKLLARLSHPMAGKLSGVVAASMSRQRILLSRGLTVMALAVSFALAVAVFNTTYAAQASVDARLTNGSDVTVSTTTLGGLPSSLGPVAANLPHVAAVEPMQHRFAYVGNDLQDLYGIHPQTIGRATSMSNAYFGNGNASATLTSLAAQPDGVLVSDETVHDFQLHPGDLIRLRLQFASDGQYHVVPFHYIGVSREFPTAPHDSFLVANASYVARRTGTPSIQTLLMRTTASPPAVAAEVRRVLGTGSGATVQDIVTQEHVTLSALTAVDVRGLTKMELTFALLLAAGSSGLVLAIGISERKRTFAIASALGARGRQLSSFVWSEAVFVGGGGLVLGAAVGFGIAEVLVRILSGVFDPPPDSLSAPWLYLLIALLVAVGAFAVSGVAMLGITRRPPVEILRDL
ncbi:MAG: FtsX-like permease family protein [Actinomycetota bacterium]